MSHRWLVLTLVVACARPPSGAARSQGNVRLSFAPGNRAALAGPFCADLTLTPYSLDVAGVASPAGAPLSIVQPGAVFGEAAIPQLPAECVIGGTIWRGNDRIDVVGRPDRRGPRIGQEQANRCAAHEDDSVAERTERLGHGFEVRDWVAQLPPLRSSGSFRSANLRSRESPARSASTRAIAL